jgi:hypothetical protein
MKDDDLDPQENEFYPLLAPVLGHFLIKKKNFRLLIACNKN